MKRTLIIVLCIAMVLSFVACSKTKTAEPQQSEQSEQPTATQQPTDELEQIPEKQTIEDNAQEQAPEEPQMPQSREDVMNAMLINPQWTAGEDAGQMAGNSGGQFGFIEVKQPSEDANSFQFTSEEDGAYMHLNTRLKDFGGDGRAQQAFNMKFMSQSAHNLSFAFMGMGEVVISFEEDGVYCTYVQAFEKIAFSDYMPNDFVLEDNKWYNILMAVDDKAQLRVLVWEDNNYQNQAFYEQNLDIGAVDIYDSNWQVIIGFGPSGTLNVMDYGVFMFDEFTENPPVASEKGSSNPDNPTISGLGFEQGNYENVGDGVRINIQSIAWGGAEKDIIYYTVTMYDVEFGVEILYPEKMYKIHFGDDLWYLYDPINFEVIDSWFDVDEKLRALVGEYASTVSDDLVGFINSYCENGFGYTPDELIMMPYE